MKRFTVAAAALALTLIVAGAVAQDRPAATIVRDPGCGCCLNWVALLEQAGFKTTVTESAARRTDGKVPDRLRSCHTATIDGYAIEGHVPIADVKRLLKERPALAGIAVPGMPMGSPGMEVPDGRKQPFDVVAFDKAGKLTVFASHR